MQGKSQSQTNFSERVSAASLIALAVAVILSFFCCTPSPCPTGFKCECIAITTPPDTVIVPYPSATPFFIGVNTNNYQEKTKQDKFTGTRLYLPIGWVYTAKGMYAQPMLNGQKQFLGVDDYLSYMKDKGVDVLLTLMESPDWLNGHSEGWLTNKYPPLRPGADRLNPESWKEVAAIYRAFAVRYGAKAWPKGTYPVDPAPARWYGDKPQEELSGLGLVKWIEVGNEVDAWWNMAIYLTPEEHAVMLSVCYDAIKSADPNMKVAMAGLTNADVSYLRRMKDKFTAMGRQFLSDCVHIHHYSSGGNIAGVHPPTWLPNQAVSLEEDKAAADFVATVAFAKEIGVNEIWVSEYGYDTRPNSQMSPMPQPGKNLEQIQAEWLPRATLEYARLGATRCYFFTIADEPNPDGGTFNSCGVLYGEAKGYAEKPAFAAVALLASALKGMRFVKDESTPVARIMRFEGGGKATYAYWSPSSDSRTLQVVIGGKSVTVTESVQYLRIGI